MEESDSQQQSRVEGSGSGWREEVSGGGEQLQVEQSRAAGGGKGSQLEGSCLSRKGAIAGGGEQPQRSYFRGSVQASLASPGQSPVEDSESNLRGAVSGTLPDVTRCTWAAARFPSLGPRQAFTFVTRPDRGLRQASLAVLPRQLGLHCFTRLDRLHSSSLCLRLCSTQPYAGSGVRFLCRIVLWLFVARGHNSLCEAYHW